LQYVYIQSMDSIECILQFLMLHVTESKKQELDLAKKQSGSLPPVYGHKMSDFLKEVDKAHANKKFSRKPIGPIGTYL
jgi:hypothetical protein